MTPQPPTKMPPTSRAPQQTPPPHLVPIVQNATGSHRHSATVIFFHGLGDRADNLVQWIRYLLGGRNLLQHHAHIRIILPTAPRQPFTTFGGRPANVWFDAYGSIANIGLPERRTAFAGIDLAVRQLIDEEVANGIPLERIAVAGFSMGGQMALHAALRLRPGCAGVCGLSTFLAHDTAVYEDLERGGGEAAACGTPMRLWHGDSDELIPHSWGRVSFEELRRLGVRGEFRTIVGMRHEMRAQELLEVEQWLAELLPPRPGDVVNKL